ncbi:MAG: energy transducer TonB [Actinomycetota bacterium]
MLNQLIESKNNKEENARKGGFLLTTLGVLAAVLLSGWTYSLFAKSYGMGTGDFDLSSIVTPVTVNEDPPPKPEIKIEKSQKTSPEKIILKDLYEDISKTTTPPKDLRGEKEVVNARQFNLSDVNSGAVNQIPANVGRTGNQEETGCGLCPSMADNKPNNDEKTPEVVVKPSPKPSEPKITKPLTGGVLNGRASYLAKPLYPAAAKQIRAEGAVNVQVLIDEKGNVVSASAVSGNPLLRGVAERAARESKFTPTLLSNQPVKVTGIIVYNFTL